MVGQTGRPKVPANKVAEGDHMKNYLTSFKTYLILGSLFMVIPHLNAQRRGNGPGHNDRGPRHGDHRGPRHDNQRNQVNIKSLLDVAQNIADASTLKGRRFEQAIRPAIYELRMMALKVRDRKISRTLNLASEKLQDHYLQKQRRIAISLDCLKQVITDKVYSTQIQYKPQGVRVLTKLGKLLTQACLFGQANSIFFEIEKLAYQAIGHRRTAKQVAETAELAQLKLSDSYLTSEQKIYFVNDCAQIILNKI